MMSASEKKRWVKRICIVLLVGGIVILWLVNTHGQEQEPTPVSSGAVTPTPAAWIPTGDQLVDEDRIPPNTVLIKNFAYYPPTLTVSPGTAIQIVNADTASHSVTSDAGFFDTGILGPQEEGILTFSRPGTYSYHCRRHSAMQARIVVTP